EGEGVADAQGMAFEVGRPGKRGRGREGESDEKRCRGGPRTAPALPEGGSDENEERYDGRPRQRRTGERDEPVPQLRPREPRMPHRRVVRDEEAGRHEPRDDGHLAVDEKCRDRPERPEHMYANGEKRY